MGERGMSKRNVASVGAAAVLLAGTTLLTMPGTAAAETLTSTCGSSVTGQVGDQLKVDPSTLFLLPKGTLPALDFGTIAEGKDTKSKSVVSGLVTKVCSVTVTGMSPVTEPVESATKPVTDAVGDAAKPVTDGAKAVEEILSGGTKPSPAPGESPGGSEGGPQQSDPDRNEGGVRDSNSKAAGDVAGYQGAAPGFTFGSLPMMSGFSALPYYNSSFSPAPGVLYGGGVPGYSPEFGILGSDAAGSSTIQNAGSADALPAGRGDVGLPVLLAVLALAGASAGLVRTWVLRRVFA